MQLIVPTDRVQKLVRPLNSTVTLVNQSATDVYFDSDLQRLAASLPGAVPSGTKIAANGGQLQIALFPGILYLRAAASTFIEVQP